MPHVFTTARQIVLASASPRRIELIGALCPGITCVDPGPGEPVPENNEAPYAYAQRAALYKAMAVAAVYPEALIIGADTVVVLPEGPVEQAALQGRVFGKPASPEQAFAMLQSLSGQAHMVITACALLAPQSQPHIFYDSAIVRMGKWPEQALRAYARSGEPMDKAGAYAVQGQGAFLIEGIEGAWTTVVGLPVPMLGRYLLENGAIVAV